MDGYERRPEGAKRGTVLPWARGSYCGPAVGKTRHHAAGRPKGLAPKLHADGGTRGPGGAGWRWGQLVVAGPGVGAAVSVLSARKALIASASCEADAVPGAMLSSMTLQP